MGQYYLIVNLDKQEYLHAHRFGDGLKLCEFGSSGNGTMFGLAVLLADGNGRGGGDLHIKDPAREAYVGRWAGDKIVIDGDYADEGRWASYVPGGFQPKDGRDVNLFAHAEDHFKDISEEVLLTLLEDSWFEKSFLPIEAENPGYYKYRTGTIIKEMPRVAEKLGLIKLPSVAHGRRLRNLMPAEAV